MSNLSPDGVLVIDKPKGLTSHDIVDIVRRLYGIRRVGHAGTLDPMATGVLVVLLGKATKLSGHLLNSDKEYFVKMLLGVTTDTGDAFGTVTAVGSADNVSEDLIRKTVLDFKGEIKQVPPMYSAIKHKGVSLYKLARKGINIPRKERSILITDIEIVEMKMPYISLNVSCSKGTYIRQLCVDIGTRLNCGAHAVQLKRLKSGSFALKEAITIDDLKKLSGESLFRALIDTSDVEARRDISA